MDPQLAYAMERWRQMMNAQAGVTVSPETSRYRGIVDQYKIENPNLLVPNTDVLMRQMQHESKMNPEFTAAGPRGDEARGLMQVKPGTARDMVKKGYLTHDADIYNPEDNIQLGMAYLDHLKRQYGGGVEDTLQRYTLGPKNFREGKRRPGYVDDILGTHNMSAVFDPEGRGYDEREGSKWARRYPLTLPKPKKYQGDYVTQKNAFQAWVWNKEKKEYEKHSASLNPKTGMVLKGRTHETWKLMEDEEKRRGNVIVKRNGRYYSVPAKRR